MELKKTDLPDLFQGLVEENRSEPPKSAGPMCNQCRKRIPGAKCTVYSAGIPKSILFGRESCKEFKQK